MGSDVLVHLEHGDLGLLEYGVHLGVANNLALVLRILQIIGLDVFPELVNDLKS